MNSTTTVILILLAVVLLAVLCFLGAVPWFTLTGEGGLTGGPEIADESDETVGAAQAGGGRAEMARLRAENQDLEEDLAMVSNELAASIKRIQELEDRLAALEATRQLAATGDLLAAEVLFNRYVAAGNWQAARLAAMVGAVHGSTAALGLIAEFHENLALRRKEKHPSQVKFAWMGALAALEVALPLHLRREIHHIGLESDFSSLP